MVHLIFIRVTYNSPTFISQPCLEHGAQVEDASTDKLSLPGFGLRNPCPKIASENRPISIGRMLMHLIRDILIIDPRHLIVNSARILGTAGMFTHNVFLLFL